jgi:putative transposase
MRLTYKYRLYPTSAQRSTLRQTLAACRWVYNQVLATRKTAWEERGARVSRYDTIKMLPGWKADHPWLKGTHSQVLQEVCARVDLAFQHFFRRVKAGETPGYPRFKGRGWYKSFTYPQSGFGITAEGKLHLAKIGDVKIQLHRPLVGDVKTLTLKRDALGNWWACFAVDVAPDPLPSTPERVGVDVGLATFAVLSTGEPVANPRFFRRDERALARAQRKLATCAKGTPEYRKRQRVVPHIHQRIANRRQDFAHQLSHRLVDAFQIIAFEDLDIPAMQDGTFRGMNKSIGDAAWGQLRQFTRYKAERAGRAWVAVEPRGTSQTCSGCGEVVRKTLSERVHACPHCGLVLDRDHNAALNILARGLSCLGLVP